MPAVAALVLRVLQLIGELLGIAEILQGFTQHAAQEATPYRIQGQVDWIGQQLTASGTGLSAISGKLDTVIALLGDGIPGVLEAIAALPDGSGLINPTNLSASEVWQWPDPNGWPPGTPYGDEIAETHRMTVTLASRQILKVSGAPFFLAQATWSDPDTRLDLGTSPKPDWTDIRLTDTRFTWLNRTDPYLNWYPDAGSGSPYGVKPLAVSDLVWWLDMTEAEFNALKSRNELLAAPIWPGIDKVTLGEPVVLTETAIVAGPMDGILLTVDSGPGGAGQWGVGDFRSYYRAGYVVFLDADGHADTTQFIGPDDNVFAPKGMATAGSVVVGLNKATQITVTPWTLGVTP